MRVPESSKKALVGGLAANLAIAVMKFLVAAITGSSVMIAEGIHSLVDTGNSGLMLFGRRRSRRRPDRTHPFGYGMELYFWSFVVAMIVFLCGGGLTIYEGITALVHPHSPTSLWQNYAIIGGAAVFESASLVIGLREFDIYRREKRYPGSILRVIRASKNPAIFLTVLEDTAALLGLAIAAVGITLAQLLDCPALDGVASILIGAVLMVEALLLGYECRELIIGEAARTIVIDKIKRVAAQYDELGVVDRLRTLQLGPDAVLVVLRLKFPPAIVVAELQRAVGQLVNELRAAIPAIKHVVFDLAGEHARAG